MLNKTKGNMYPFVTHTWNVIKGKCIHDCCYCYMKIYKLNDLRFDKSELTTDLGKDNFIFVGSSTDMFARNVGELWINATLRHIKKFNRNTYLFQSKNPMRFLIFKEMFPSDIVLGTTIETNRDTSSFSKAPNLVSRINAMFDIPFRKMVTIEPIMDFDLNELAEIIKYINPEWVNIGADSKGHNLPEPSTEKILSLIQGLKVFTNVKIKGNLERLL